MQKVDLPPMSSSRHPAAPNRRLVLLAYECLCTFEFGIAVEAFGRADELTGGGGHDYRDLRAALHEPAHQGRRLIGRNPARHAHDQFATLHGSL